MYWNFADIPAVLYASGLIETWDVLKWGKSNPAGSCKSD